MWTLPVTALVIVASVAAGALGGWATAKALFPSRGELAAAARTVLSPDMTMSYDHGGNLGSLAVPDLPPWFGTRVHKVEATIPDGDHEQAWQDASVRMRESGWFPARRSWSGPGGTSNDFLQGQIRVYVQMEGSNPVQVTASARHFSTAQMVRTGTRMGAAGGAVLGVVLAALFIARLRRGDDSGSRRASD